ncbi:hypothetical protein KY290_031094 [Solanum tuberosum]|uniref:Uncharacterized protein n=1 Tax=Solanum tuberosum TaxID=4113 RepID=A0ABQ7U9S6_SOLTU|nr:hypothetical protein KY290_031094 [Solanum tuberosum]
MRAYGCKDNGDFGGYEDSHNQEPNENESYYSGGEYERNVEHSSYGEDRGEENSCGSSYDDEGAYERSYSHSESEDGSYDDAKKCYTSNSQDEGKVSRSSVCGYTSSRQSQPRGRRECVTLKSNDTISYTSQGNAHLSRYGNQGKYEGYVKGLGTKRIDFPISKGWPDPEAYLDWEWQCEQILQRRDLRDPERPLYTLGHLKGLALGWWTQKGRL